MSDLLKTLKERGFVDTISHEELASALDNPISLYLGFDPTATSLHLGNLVGVIALKWFEKFGHKCVVLVGGATARIGDPSGKSKERPLLSEEDLQSNIQGLKAQLSRFFDFSEKENAPILLDNFDWLSKFTFIDFLRDVGKHFRMSTMLAKESVKQRLTSEEGMSFTEFTYQMLQGYDFYHLNTERNVVLEIGGSDQWGNITSGIEYVRKRTGKPVFGLTFPLLTRSDGKKFGKSEQGAIWLDKSLCSYYQFYQYFISIPDDDVVKLLKMLTFLDLEEINKIQNQMQAPDYIPNTAQKILAKEVTELVHGEDSVAIAQRVTEALAPGSKAILDGEILEQIAHDFPKHSIPRDELVGMLYVNLIAQSGLVSSKSEAHRLVKNNGAYLNNSKVDDSKKVISLEDIIADRFLVASAGKKKKILIEIVE